MTFVVIKFLAGFYLEAVQFPTTAQDAPSRHTMLSSDALYIITVVDEMMLCIITVVDIMMPISVSCFCTPSLRTKLFYTENFFS